MEINRLSLPSSWISLPNTGSQLEETIFIPGLSTCTQVFLALFYSGVQNAKNSAASISEAMIKLSR